MPHSIDPAARRRIVVDTDPGVDDAWALLFLAARADVEIVAVGASHGNVPTDVSAANALRILDVAGLDEVPVASGPPGPLQQPLATAEFVHGLDGLGEAAGPPSPREPSSESAAEQLVRLARLNPGELTLLALAPLTNLALALRMEPGLPRLLKNVVWMGGRFRVPGNVTAWADANAGHDPEAAEEVVRAGFDLVMVPMDITAQAWADDDWFQEMAAADTPATRFATAISGTYRQVYTAAFGRGGCELHDPMAAAIMLDPTLATYTEKQVVVDLAGHGRGATLVDERPFTADFGGIHDGRPTVRIATTVDAKRAMEEVRQALLAARG